MAFVFVCENESFFNWTGSVFALRDTKCSLHEYVKKTTKQFLESWPLDEKYHFRTFILHNVDQRLVGTAQLYTLKCACTDCNKVYKRLLELKTRQGEPLQLETPTGEDWWILLKMYLPKGNTNVGCLEKCDVAVFCSLLKRCQLFDEIDSEKLDRIVSIRNKLMHSNSNELSPQDKREYLGGLESFLRSSSFENYKEIQETIEKMQLDQCRLHHFVEALDEFEEVREAFDIQKKAINRDLEEFKELQIERPGLETLLKRVQENQDTVNELIDTKNELNGTLNQAVEMGKREGSKEAGFVGTVPGGAGAYMAGRFKMAFDNN